MGGRVWGVARLAALRGCGRRVCNYPFWYALRRGDAAGGRLYMRGLLVWVNMGWEGLGAVLVLGMEGSYFLNSSMRSSRM